MSFDPSKPYNDLPNLPLAAEIETKAVIKACVRSRAALAALRQATALIPNPAVLINTIPLLEAQASSEIENIVTTTDALFRHAQLESLAPDPATNHTHTATNLTTHITTSARLRVEEVLDPEEVSS